MPHSVWHGQAAALSGLPVALHLVIVALHVAIAVIRHGQTVQSDGLPVPHQNRRLLRLAFVFFRCGFLLFFLRVVLRIGRWQLRAH